MNIGVTDCGGINLVSQAAYVITLLAKIARKLKTMAVVVDAEDLNIESRGTSIVNSLRSKELILENPTFLKEYQVYQAWVKGKSNLKLIIQLMATSHYLSKNTKSKTMQSSF